MILKELFAKLGFKVDDRSFSKAQSALNATKKTFLAVGTAAVAAGAGILKLVDSTAREGDRLAKTAPQIGLTAESLQELEFAADRAGVSQQSFIKGMRNLQRVVFDAKRGLADAKDSFKELGVDVKDSNGNFKDTETLFEDIVAAFNRLEDGPVKTGVAMKLFSRAGAEMIPLFNGGVEGLRDLRQEFKRLGGGLSNFTSAQGEKYVDALTDMKRAQLALKDQIAGPLIGTFTEYIQSLTEWFLANKKIISQRINIFIKAVGATLQLMAKAAGMVIKAVATLVGWLRELYEWVQENALIAMPALIGATFLLVKALGSLVAALVVAKAQAIATAAVAIASWTAAAAPVILLAGLVTGLVYLLKRLWEWFGLGELTLEGLGKAFQEMAQFISDTFTETIDSWISGFTGFFDWLFDQIADIPNRIKRGFESAADSVLDFVGLGPEASIPRGLAGVPNLAAPRFGGGNSPAASAASSPANTTTRNQTVQINQTVNASEGMSAEDVARISTDKINETLGAEFRGVR